MEKPQSIGRLIVNIGLLAGFLILLYAVFELVGPGLRPASPAGPTITELSPQLDSVTELPAPTEGNSYPSPYPPSGSGISPLPQVGTEPSPYPPPHPWVTPVPYLPQAVQALNAKSSFLSGVKTVVLEQGVIWLMQGDRQPEALVDYNDVTGIFGWNYDGSKLLFGRGRFITYGELSDAIELWLYDSVTKKSAPCGG